MLYWGRIGVNTVLAEEKIVVLELIGPECYIDLILQAQHVWLNVRLWSAVPLCVRLLQESGLSTQRIIAPLWGLSDDIQYIFFQSCWATRDHIGRPTGISNPAWHLPQVVPRVVQTTGSVQLIPARKGGFTNSWLHSSVKHTLYEQEDFPFMGRELKGGKNWRKNKLKPRIINYNCDETSKTLRPSGRIGHRRTGTCATTPRHGHWFNRGEIEKLPGFLLHESIKECTHDL